MCASTVHGSNTVVFEGEKATTSTSCDILSVLFLFFCLVFRVSFWENVNKTRSVIVYDFSVEYSQELTVRNLAVRFRPTISSYVSYATLILMCRNTVIFVFIYYIFMWNTSHCLLLLGWRTKTRKENYFLSPKKKKNGKVNTRDMMKKREKSVFWNGSAMIFYFYNGDKPPPSLKIKRQVVVFASSKRNHTPIFFCFVFVFPLY